ncbi:hypothetical protein ACFVUS_07600 [Nocardia sp. NPDC058058]|uniref:TY-Chap domain-containing protein n=1 Tax=Nocardia sp. NPDC058058 TaxID=3346317 RepID=UPI0036DA9379
MIDYRWERLLEEMPRYMSFGYPHEPDGEVIQLRDAETGCRVVFQRSGGFVVKVPIPADPVVAHRAIEVLRGHRTTNTRLNYSPSGEVVRARDRPMWSPAAIFDESAAESVRQVETDWLDNDRFRREVAAAVIEVLRDGFGATPERLRYTVAGDSGPMDALCEAEEELTAVAPDRPSHRGAPEICTEWRDFADRLEWSLSTLPRGGAMNLRIAEGSDVVAIQFVNRSTIHNQCFPGNDAAADPHAQHTKMVGLGWHWAPVDMESFECPLWLGPVVRGPRLHTLGDLVPRTIATFREVFGVRSPQDLCFYAGHEEEMDQGLFYLNAELGIARA